LAPPGRFRLVKRSYWSLVCLLAVLASSPCLLAAQDQNAGGALDKVLKQMDVTAQNFASAQADFVWDQFQQVVNDHDIQKGKIYFRRSGKDTQMMADITEHNGQATPKYLLYSGGKVQVYEPKVDRVTAYPPGKNKADVESFLTLGFGGGGHDLLKAFDVKYLGTERIEGVDTAKLDLIPKSKSIRGMFDHFVLWVDPARGVSLKQQAFEPGTGDYRLTTYSNIQLNQRLPDNIFKLKTTGKTQFVSPQG
jgi:outer membrane lipoprotein-sorting protein